MTGKTFQFDFRDLKLTVDQIERVMGYSEGESHEPFNEIVSKLLKEAEVICNLKAEYRIFEKISFNEYTMIIEISNVVFNIGKIIFGQIKKSGSAALFICTAGGEIGVRSRKAMKEGDMLEGYIFDIIGNEAVEAATDLMQNDIEADLALSGQKITNRFSPGYCGWNVAEQHKLFSLMPTNYCGIRLNESALMNPIKSISGIIGIGENVKRLPYTCKLCDMKDCIYRRKG
ncbi:MAG: methionine synthase [Bacteroidia bacterium]|nr:methionine synthase [Bacteroidia bacterium]